MRKDVAILLVLLFVSNAVWATLALDRSSSEGSSAASLTDAQKAALLDALVEEAPRASGSLDGADRATLAAAREAGSSTVRGSGYPEAAPGAGPPSPALSGTESAPSPRPRAAPAREPVPAAGDDAVAQVGTWKSDVLQITDPDRRERGLAAIDAAIRSPDAALAAAALRSLYDLRDVAYDKARFREAVLARLSDEDPRVREPAAYALMQVAREDGDVQRVLDAAEGAAGSDRILIVAAWLSRNRVEGRLADLYVRALAAEDAREVVEVANQLRGMWVAPEVEEAVVEAWGRTRDRSLWNHILGQITPTRESPVRVIFEILRKDDTSAPQLLDRALEPRNLDPAAAPIAAALAIEALPAAPNALIRRLFLEVLRDHGTAEHAPAVLAYAENPMVAEDLRGEAAKVAEVLSRRPR